MAPAQAEATKSGVASVAKRNWDLGAMAHRAPKSAKTWRPNPFRANGESMPSVSSTPRVTSEDSLVAAEGADRRGSGKRARARDRLMDRGSAPNPRTEALAGVGGIDNLLLFIDDDLRETALAVQRIERFLLSTLELLERDKLGRSEVQKVANDTTVLDHVDTLNETLESLRRRMARLAANLR
jgi:hypothetical protein